MTELDHGTSPTPSPLEPPAPVLLERVSVFARLGRWTATRLRLVLLSWLTVLVVFGIFAPQVETALSGAGWQDSSSASVQARNIIQRDFSGLGSAALEVVVVDHHGPIASDPAALSLMNKAAVLLRADARVSKVVMPSAGTSISRNGRTAIITAGSAAGTNVMVKAANDLAGPIQELSGPGVTLTLTGDSALWADFNNANRSAMLRSEMQHTHDALIERIADSETKILRAFFSFAESNQARLSETERESAALKERMGILERRLTDVERRVNFPNHPTQ